MNGCGINSSGLECEAVDGTAVDTLMKCRVSQTAEKFLTLWAYFQFLGKNSVRYMLPENICSILMTIFSNMWIIQDSWVFLQTAANPVYNNFVSFLSTSRLLCVRGYKNLSVLHWASTETGSMGVVTKWRLKEALVWLQMDVTYMV
jgi:putative flippase GtrA